MRNVIFTLLLTVTLGVGFFIRAGSAYLWDYVNEKYKLSESKRSRYEWAEI